MIQTQEVTMRTKLRAVGAGEAASLPEAIEPRPIVLVREDGAAHGAASLWARRLMEALDTTVVVVRLIAEPAVRANMLFPQWNTLDALSRARQAQRVMTSRARWQRRFAPPESAPAMLSIAGNDPGRLAEALTPLSARVVVVPSTPSWAMAAGRLAAECSVPVLIARGGPGRAAQVVAASNLRHRLAPVLQQAAQWSQALGRQLTFVHNLEPAPVEELGHVEAPTEQALAQLRVQQLERLAQRHDADAAVTRTPDPVSGVLSVVEHAEADLLVVGVHPHGSAHGVAARLIESSRQSVLIVPLPDSATGP